MSAALSTAIAFVFGVLSGIVGLSVWRRLRGPASSRNTIDYERLLADIDEAIAVEGEDGTVLFANDSFAGLVGVDPVGESIDSVLASVPGLQQRVVEKQEGIETIEHESETRHYEVALFPIREQSTGQLVLLHDVTNQETRRQRLEEQNEQLELFASLVSHDLRNPLDVALGRTTALAESTDDPELTTHIESTQHALKRMNTIITDVLTVAQMSDDVSDTDAVSLTEASECAWKTVKTDDATLRAQTDAVITASRDGLRHVLENLFRNAIEHGSTGSDPQTRQNAEAQNATHSRTQSDDTVEGGSTSSQMESDDAVEQEGTDVTVTIGTLPEDDGFFVEDDGRGIPEDRRQEVRKLGESGSSCGCGLGLAIVENISQAHGWELSITDGADGGARFEFTGVELEQPSFATRT